jgi:hypothetical protein
MVSDRLPTVSRPAPMESCRPALILTSIHCRAEVKPTFPSSPLPFPTLSLSTAPLCLLLPQPTSSAMPRLFPLCRLGFLLDGAPSVAQSTPPPNHRSTTKPPSAFTLHVDSSPSAMIRRPTTSVSSALAPQCSLTQPLGASTTRSSHPHRPDYADVDSQPQ